MGASHQALLMYGGAGGGGGDPFWSYVTVLLNMGGSDGSTAFVDEKGNAVTAYGNAQIDTSLGYNTGLFDGSGDYLTVAYSSGMDLTSGDWTIEVWGVPNSFSGDQTLICKDGQSGVSYPQYTIYVTSVGQVVGIIGTGTGTSSLQYIFTPSGALTAGVPFHIAMCLEGTTLRIYIDGIQQSFGTKIATMTNDASKPLYVAYQQDQPSSDYFNGHQRAVRITKGVCRFSGGTSFTPETPPLPTS
jgi:hypothetical protein